MADIRAQISTQNLRNKQQEPHFLNINAGNKELQTERDKRRKRVLCSVVCRYLSNEKDGDNQNFSLPPW